MPTCLDLNCLGLNAYFERIKWTGGANPTLQTLTGPLCAHVSNIPFENLDVLLRRGVCLDLVSIQKKLVHAKRGDTVLNMRPYLQRCSRQSVSERCRLGEHFGAGESN